MKVLSVRNPLSYLICAGVKDVENRTWTTKYRGRLLIHSSGQYTHHCIDKRELPDAFLQGRIEGKRGKIFSAMDNLTARLDIFYHCKTADDFVTLMTDEKRLKKQKPYFLNMAIIGEITLVDIVKNSKSPFADSGYYHWLLTDAVLYDYDDIIYPVKGKLGLWNFDRKE